MSPIVVAVVTAIAAISVRPLAHPATAPILSGATADQPQFEKLMASIGRRAAAAGQVLRKVATCGPRLGVRL
jgi:hypothetical protein